MTIRAPKLRSVKGRSDGAAVVAPRARRAHTPRARGPRDNPSGRVVFFGYAPHNITVTINSGDPDDLVSELFWQTIIFLQQAFMKRNDPAFRYAPMMAAACALAYLRVRFVAVRDRVLGQDRWPSDEMRKEYEKLAQDTLSQAESFLADPAPDMDTLQNVLRRALAEGLVINSRAINPINVRGIFYIDALVHGLEWRGDVGDEAVALIHRLYQRDMPLIPQRAAVHGAYRIGLELFENNGSVHKNPFGTVSDLQLRDLFEDYLEEDMMEYKHRKPTNTEAQIGLLEFGEAQTYAVSFIFDPTLDQRGRPFDV